MSGGVRAQLKLLACHISGGEQSGTVFVNGVPIIEAEFKNQLAVVWQSDVLLATATVRPCTSLKKMMYLRHQLMCCSLLPRCVT